MERPNPYAHLSEEELTDLRYMLQERYERAFDYYHDCYSEWAVVMNALKSLHESTREQQE